MSDHIPTDSADKARPAPTGDNWERAALERIALAAITEQRSARRWRIFFRFVFLAILAIAAWSAFDFTSDKVAKSARHTALVELDGEIAANSDASADNVNAALDSAFEYDGPAAATLRCKTPQPSPRQAGHITRK